MKVIAQLLIWSSLAIGAAAAASAYLVPVGDDDSSLVGLTLAAPAGQAGVDEKGEAVPLAEKDTTLDEELLDRLRAGGVKNVRVKEFSVRRWRGKWLFAASLVGLAIGGWLTRRASAAAKITSDRPRDHEDPHAALSRLSDQLDRLRASLPELQHDEQLERIIDQVGRWQRQEIPMVVEGRDELVAELGLAGFAALMDHFAAAERQLNRAWSAAVDGALDEATGCLEAAGELLQGAKGEND